jgi:hypothetical protein
MFFGDVWGINCPRAPSLLQPWLPPILPNLQCSVTIGSTSCYFASFHKLWKSSESRGCNMPTLHPQISLKLKSEILENIYEIIKVLMWSSRHHSSWECWIFPPHLIINELKNMHQFFFPFHHQQAWKVHVLMVAQHMANMITPLNHTLISHSHEVAVHLLNTNSLAERRSLGTRGETGWLAINRKNRMTFSVSVIRLETYT